MRQSRNRRRSFLARRVKGLGTLVYMGVYWVYRRIMEDKMETTIL